MFVTDQIKTFDYVITLYKSMLGSTLKFFDDIIRQVDSLGS